MAAASGGQPAPIAEIIGSIKTEARMKLLDLLDEVGQRKVLLLDSTMLSPLDLVAAVGDLKDHGVESFHRLSKTPVDVDCPQLIFIVRCSRLELIDWIAAQIHADEAKSLERTYHIVFIPCQTEQCLDRLKQRNVQANVTVIEFALHFFPSDTDVLNMEIPGVFSDYHVQGDPGTMFYTAKALTHLQAKFGVIPMIHTVGSAAKSVLEAMLKLRQEESRTTEEPVRQRELSQKGVPPVAPRLASSEQAGKQSDSDGPSQPKIAEAIIIDRRIDVYSVLCSQFTYQALIDTVYGINSNHIADVKNWETDAAAGSAGSQPAAKRKQVKLSPFEDAFFAEIRDVHIDKLGSLLQQRTEEIQAVYDQRDQLKNASATAMAEFVKKFKDARDFHSLLQTHINLAQDLKSYIKDSGARFRLEDEVTTGAAQSLFDAVEDLIDSQRPIHEVLSLLCLHSMVNSGIRQKQLDVMKKQILQAYGYEHLLTLCNLERAGLLRYAQGKSVWASLKRHFNLMVDGDAMEKDISYAYSGYAPLSVRLVQMTRSLPRGWRSCQDALNLLDGCAQEVPQATAQSLPRDASQPSVAIICFLGGVTLGELAALRRLSKLEEGRRQFLIVTTEILSTKKFFDSMRCEQAFAVPLIEASRASRTQDAQRRGAFGGLFGGR